MISIGATVKKPFSTMDTIDANGISIDYTSVSFTNFSSYPISIHI